MKRQFEKMLFIFLLLILQTYTIQLSKLESIECPTPCTSKTFSGSKQGGTVLTVSGYGFDFHNVKNNQVFVGTIPAQVTDGVVEDLSLTFTTGPSESTTDLLNQKITVKVDMDGDGKKILSYTLGNSYAFSYTSAKTPTLTRIYPSRSFGQTKIGLYGKHQIRQLGGSSSDTSKRSQGQVLEIKIGQHFCDRTIVNQQDITPGDLRFIHCITSKTHPAGKVKVSEQVFPGYALKSPTMIQPSLIKGDDFEHMIHPSILSISPSKGHILGQTISIKGNNFSPDASQITATIDGVNCNIISASPNQIICKLQEKISQKTEKIDSNSSSQVDGYIAGAGWTYERYDISAITTKSLDGFVADLKLASPKSVLNKTEYIPSVILEARTPKLDPIEYGQRLKGYFLAPKTGTYRFYSMHDDGMSLFISKKKGSAEVESVPDLRSTSYYDDQFKSPYIKNLITATGVSVDMTAGQYIYMEVYHINDADGYGFLNVGVQVPNSDNTMPNQVFKIEQLVSQYSYDMQEVEWTVSFTSSSASTYKLFSKTKKDDSGNYLYCTLNKNATTTSLRACLKNIGVYTSNLYQTDQRKGFDANDIETTVAANTVKYVYKIFIDNYRSSTSGDQNLLQTEIGTGYSIAYKSISPHSIPLGGTFSILIDNVALQDKNGNPEAFAFNCADSVIRDSLIRNDIVKFGKVNVLVEQLAKGTRRWLIQFIGANQDVNIQVDYSNLSGGNSPPTITQTTIRQYSSNILFNTITSQFMFVNAPKTNVNLEVNGIRAGCLGDCSYEFSTNIPTYTAVGLTGSVLAITISDPGTFTYKDLEITLDGQPCAIDYTVNNGPIINATPFNCQLPKNSITNTPKLRAGQYLPIIKAAAFQVHPKPTSSVAPLNVDLTASSITPINGFVNGGQILKIAGHGFPENGEIVSVTICSTTFNLKSYKNEEISFRSPSCQNTVAQNVTISYNGISKNLTFTYKTTVSATTPIINSISPQSSSPVLKKKMTITGNNFGTVISDLKVYLSGVDKTYQMKVLSATNTQIKVGIPGGLSGTYKIILDKAGQGYATAGSVGADVFKYQLEITSVTNPAGASGSYHGGTLITIAGKNFAPTNNQNMVFIGNQVNWFCRIISLTQTQIKCRTPPIHSNYDQKLAQQVVVVSKLIQQTTCNPGPCTFSYAQQASSPSLYNISTTLDVNSLKGQAKSGDTLSINGDFANCGANPKKILFYNTKTAAEREVDYTSTDSNQTLSFTVPNLQSGYYAVAVRCDPFGQTNAKAFYINSTLQTATPSLISLNGGKVSVSGTGLPANWPHKDFTIELVSSSKSYDVQVLSAAVDSLYISVPVGINNQKWTLTITEPNKNNKRSLNITTSSSTKTPSFTAISKTTISGNIDQLIKLSSSFNSGQVPSQMVYYSMLNPSKRIAIPVSVNADFTINLKPGAYKFQAYYNSAGWSNPSAQLMVSRSGTYTASAQSMSYAGGYFVISDSGANPGVNQFSTIKVGGKTGKYVKSDTSNYYFQIPPLRTVETITQYPLLQQNELVNKDQFSKIINDINGVNPLVIYDGEAGVAQYSSTGSTCFIGIDMGEELLVKLTKVRVYPSKQWTNVGNALNGAIIQSSADGITYQTVATFTHQNHVGWNSFTVSSSILPARFVRLSHTNQSACKIVQFQVWGTILSNVGTIADLSSFSIPVYFTDGTTTTFTEYSTQLQFRTDKTPIVNTVRNAENKNAGHVYGNYNITLAGTNLMSSNPLVTIDGIACGNVSATTANQIICGVGSRLNLPERNYFDVVLDNRRAIIKQQFLYVMRWSDPRTWGTDIPPVEGDYVFVPKGMTLYMDQTTPKLLGITVNEASIIFADQSDIQIHTGFISVIRGKFEAGTQKKPYQRKLLFVMYGDYFGKQQPMWGNKGISMFQGKFSMYGTPVQTTWTQLAATADAGATSITLQEAPDWKQGDMIVIASTDYDYDQAEKRYITSVSGKTVTFSTPLKYKHLSVNETYTATHNGVTRSHHLAIKAEVGMYTRNIKMMGDPSDSWVNNYGSHLMMTGKSTNGLVGHIAYSQFTLCGQPKIIGRYCTHFHMNGDVAQSYVRGIAVHDSMARILTIHGVHSLTVERNVGYNVHGHNFFLEDGIETNNIIQYNLAIKSMESNMMLQTDTSTASYWITNPTNIVRYNHAAGGNFYGFWYEIKQNPDGPSARTDICPTGNILLPNHDNVAHSNKRFGVRIFTYAPRQNPCQPISQTNPSVQARFYNYMLYKNEEVGLLAQRSGNLIFDNFTIADNRCGAMQFWKAHLAGDIFTIAKNSAVIGLSKANNNQDVNQFKCTTFRKVYKGILTPRSDGLYVKDVDFFNHPTPLYLAWTCAECNNPCVFINGARQSFWQGITVNNATTTKRFFMLGHKKQIVYDIDGSFTKSANFDATDRTLIGSQPGTFFKPKATLTWGWPHMVQSSACKKSTTPSQWDDAVACDSSVRVRRVVFGGLQKKTQFEKTDMRVYKLDNIAQKLPYQIDNKTNLAQGQYSSIVSYLGKLEPGEDRQNSYALPYVTGSIYNIWWYRGIDFTKLDITSSQYYQDDDPAIIFRVNHTTYRETFDIQNQGTGIKMSNLTETTALDPATCVNGNYTLDPENRYLYMCITSRKRPSNQTKLLVDAVFCRYACPQPPGEYKWDGKTRRWSNPLDWENRKHPNGTLIGTVPQANDTVVIEGTWKMILDVTTPAFYNISIMGDLIVEPDRDIKGLGLTSNFIWVYGSLEVGTVDSPFKQDFTITLTGNRNDAGFAVTPQIASSKLMVNMGEMNLHGNPPSITRSKLKRSAFIGETIIQVINNVQEIWKIGDSIGISPSFISSNEYEQLTIKSFPAPNQVQFEQPLAFKHYGAASTTIPSSQTKTLTDLDTRATVIHLTRNIKIKAGADENWGYRFVNYKHTYNRTYTSQITKKVEWYLQPKIGTVNFTGVEFINGGQYGTENVAFHGFKTLNYSKDESNYIMSSSFQNCKTYCILLQQSQNYIISNNVFFKAVGNIVKMKEIGNIQFKNNILIGADRSDLAFQRIVSCLMLEHGVNSTVQIKDNTCQGSYGHGFAIPYTQCTDASSTTKSHISNNLVGSAKIGFLFTKNNQGCQEAADTKAYACQYCHMSHSPSTTELRVKRLTYADCTKRAMNLRYGSSGDDRSAIVNNVYINAISRPDCDFCYTNSGDNISYIPCANQQAVRLLAITVNGQKLPDKYGTGYDVICRTEIFDAKSFWRNAIFKNYRTIYTNPNLAQCGENFLFKPHKGATDLTGSHHFWTSKCQGCDINAFGRFQAPDVNQLGWFGGCGDIVCTGKRNYLIQDHDGSLTAGVDGLSASSVLGGTFIPSNPEIGDYLNNCTFFEKINGHFCRRHDLAVLEYESMAADRSSRIMWPVALTRESQEFWSQQTNAYIQWQWDGNQPLNKRLGRFISIVNVNSTYNMTFRSQPPGTIKFQMQKRNEEGDPNDYVFIKLHYPKPNAIRVKQRIVRYEGLKQIQQFIDIPSLPQIKGANGQLKLVSDNPFECGRNMYFHDNYTIHFVLNGSKNCGVYIQLSNSIKLNARFEMPIDEFYSKNGTTLFIDRMAALLGIKDTSRIKIVGVYSGSVTVIVQILSQFLQEINVPTTQTSGNQERASLQKLFNLLNEKIKSGQVSSTMNNAGLRNMLQAAAELNLLPVQQISEFNNNNGTQQQEYATQIGLIVGIVVGAVLIFIGAVAVVIYCMRRRARVASQEEQIPSSQGDFGKPQKKEFIEAETINAFDKNWQA